MRAKRAPLRPPVSRGPSIPDGRPSLEKVRPSIRSPLTFRPKDILFLQIIASSLDDLPFFDLPEKYGVQDLAPRGSRHDDQGVPFLLGSGTSCHVVQHQTAEDTSEIVPKDSIVALKIYRQEGVDYSSPSTSASQDLAQVIWQDIRVLCHPYLRNHENFCKLLYVGWEPFSLVPVLALELAAFGSLQDALQSESEISPRQKANISLDIAIGLSALHACGFIHGDIKPSNIMLQAHDHRQIVAKILDFSGVTDLTNYGTSGHRSYMTRLWLAPEVLLGSRHVDWQKVDVYAYGLVLAHLWSYEDLDLKEIFLEASLPQTLNAMEKQDFVLYYKCCSDDEYLSVLRQALRIISKPGAELDVTNAMIPLDYLIRATLSCDPQGRKTVPDVLIGLEDFALAHNRSIPKLGSQEDAFSAELTRWRKASDRDFFIYGSAFHERSELHQQLTLQHMKVVSGGPLLDKTPLVAGTDADYEAPFSLWMLILRNEEGLDSVDDDEYYRRVLHFQIASCLLEGKGSKINEVRALDYLASAALGGIKRAMYMFHQIEASSGSSFDSPLPRKLFLVLGHLNGCSEASDILRTTEPAVYGVAQLLVNLIHWSDLAKDVPGLLVVLPPQSSAMQDNITGLSKDVRALKGDPELFVAIENGEIAAVEGLLKQGFNPNALNHCGMSALHALTLIEDEVAAKVVSSLVQAGADLGREFTEPHAYWKNRVCNGRGSPLIWAIVKNRPLLVDRLLKLGAPCEMSALAHLPTSFVVMVFLRRYEMIENLSRFPNSIAAAISGSSRSQIIHDTIRLCIEEYNDGNSIGRRWSLAKDFDHARQATMQLLLRMGANPIRKDPNFRHTALAKAILDGDMVFVKASVEHLEEKGIDVDSLMNRTGILSQGATEVINWSALRGSLHAPCRKAFMYILGRFPGTIDQVSGRRLSPLSHAANEGAAFAVEELLKHGATLQYSQNGSSPFIDALCSGHIEVADLLLQRIDRAKLLDPNALSSGRNAFGLILHTYTSGRKHITLDTFRYLKSIGGLPFYTDVDGETAFRVFFRKGRPSYHEHRARDLALLQFFLQDDIFRNRIDDIDDTGRTGLHYAAIYVYPEAAEMLLKRGANANLEMIETPKLAAANRNITFGRTALDLLVNSHIHGAPKDIKFGGSSEIRGWNQRLAKTVKLLHDNGGSNGSNAPAMYGLHVQKIVDPSHVRHIHIQYATNPTPGDETWRGQWPNQIPQCPTLHATGSSAIRRERSSPGSGSASETEVSASYPDLRNRTLIYRTRKGKKIKITELELQVIGALIESSSEEETEQTQENKRKQLKDVRSVIEKKMIEMEMGEVSLLSVP